MTQAELLGRKIGEIRGLRGLSQKDLAAAAGVTEGYLSLIEHGHRNVTDETLGRLARVLRVPAEMIKLLAAPEDPKADPDGQFADLIARTKRTANKILEQSGREQ